MEANIKLPFFIGLLFLLASSAYAQTQNKLCVLAFERKEHPIAKSVEKIFRNQPGTRVILEATPKDLMKCITDDFEEVVSVIHALEMDKTKLHVNLGYFTEMNSEERENYLTTTKQLIDAELLKSLSRKEERKLRKFSKRLSSLSDETPLYHEPHVIFNRFFENVEKVISDKHTKGELKLKKFRLMSCAKELIAQRYPFFNHLNQYDIEFDAAPSSRLWSRIKGRSVTQFNARWLKQSLTSF